MINALHKAGLANLTDVALSYDDTSKRVTVKCGRRVVVKLRGDIARMFVSLTILLSELLMRKFHPCLTQNWKSIFLCIHGYHQESIS